MRTTPPFRADHVGSLLRPPAVADAPERFDRGEISAADRRAVEDAAIREIDATRPDGGTVVSAQGALRVEGRVALGETIFADDFAYVQSLVTEGTPKLTIPSPNMIYA